MQITKFRWNRHLTHHFIKQVWEPRMQNHIILPFLKHSNTFVQCLNVYWVNIWECCGVFLGAKELNFEDMYFIQLKVLRKNNWFSPCAKPSNGVSFWWLHRRRMLYRFLKTFLWANDCERRESFLKYVKNANICHPHQISIDGLDIYFSMRHMSLTYIKLK